MLVILCSIGVRDNPWDIGESQFFILLFTKVKVVCILCALLFTTIKFRMHLKIGRTSKLRKTMQSIVGGLLERVTKNS